MNIRNFRNTDLSIYTKMSEAFYASDACTHTVPHHHALHTFNHIIDPTDTLHGFIFESEQNVILGYVLFSIYFSCEHDAYILFIDELFVNELSRGQGVGNAFFEWLFEHYPPSVYKYRLEVNHDNEKALRFYQRLGFKTRDYLQLFR